MLYERYSLRISIHHIRVSFHISCTYVHISLVSTYLYCHTIPLHTSYTCICGLRAALRCTHTLTQFRAQCLAPSNRNLQNQKGNGMKVCESIFIPSKVVDAVKRQSPSPPTLDPLSLDPVTSPHILSRAPWMMVH